MQRSVTLFFTEEILLSLSISPKTEWMSSTTYSDSLTSNPLVVMAGEPILRPLVTMGDLCSFGTEFLFNVILALPNTFSPSAPVMSVSLSSTKNKWQSVPSDTICTRVPEILMPWLVHSSRLLVGKF